MRKTLVVAAALLMCSLVPSSAFAWGFVAHRTIMRRAIELLPAQLKPFFVANREEIVMRSVDPDLWRVAGWDDDPSHFLDFGAKEFGPFPFAALPRDHGAALEKFGAAAFEDLGTLPWREAEQFGNLRRGFEGFKRQSPYASSDVILFSAVASHYIQDAHQPFHASVNYDGQMTGNRGIHARFERDLIERFESRLTINPAPPVAITNPRDAAFDILLASYQLVDPILAADKAALAGGKEYDDQYFEKFFAAVRPMLEKRLSEAVTATAATIIGAWEQAGRPAVPLKDARPLEKVRQ